MRTHQSTARRERRGRGPGRWLAVVLLAASLVSASCSSGATPAATGTADAPVTVETVPGQVAKKVTLSERAAQRLGIETTALVPAQPSAPPAPSTVVPYSAVVYDSTGEAWVYVVAAPLAYVRQKVVVATVGGAKGTDAVLSSGPPAGATVVVRGVMELYGAELGIGK